MPNFNTFFSNPAIKTASLIAGGLILAALIFDAGVDVGTQSVGQPGPGGGKFFRVFGVPLPHVYISNGHGAVGAISAVGTSSITVAEPDGDQEMVLIDGNTFIDTPDGPTSTSAFMPGMHVIIIGAPDEMHEHIVAKLIRVLPPPPPQP